MTVQKMKQKIFIGTSGYNYDHWADGVIYPKGLPQNQWLEYYARFFKTVELNVTFYRLPQEKVFERWRKRTPSDFSFAIKGSRFITHVKRLKDAEEPLRNFFSRALLLEKKLSVVLWQLSPGFKKDAGRLRAFLKSLKECQRSKQKRIKPGKSEHPDEPKRITKPRHAFEFRHESWLCHEIYEMLDESGCTVCRADWPEFDVEIPLKRFCLS
ncbi:MAG: DUF72 domain-containing protein [Acidobacteriota bacterium]